MSTPSSTNRVSVWEWTQTALLAVNLTWTTFCLGGYRPETMVVTSALTGALLAVHLLARVFSPGPRAHPAGWLLLPFLVYAAVNVQWLTPVRWLGWRDWFGWAEMIAVFWVVLNGVRSPAPRRALVFSLMGLGVAAVALACYQRFVQPDWLPLGRVQVDLFATRSSGPFGTPNSLAGFLVLLLPAAGASAFRRGAGAAARLGWGALTVLLLLGLLLTISRGACLGLSLALVAWPLFSSRWSWRRRVGGAAVALGALLLAGAMLYAASSHVRERLVALVRDHGETSRPIMWRAAWKLYREHPALGSGAGSYDVLFEKYRPEQFALEPKWVHNDYLNTLSDYGVVGFALFFGACGAIAWWSWRTGGRERADAGGEAATAERDGVGDRGMTAALGIGVLAFALHLFVDYHFKIPALAMAFATVAALGVRRAWSQSSSAAGPLPAILRLGLVAAATGALAATGIFYTVFSAEEFRLRARETVEILAGKPPDQAEYRVRVLQAEDDLSRAVGLDAGNAQAWSDLAYVTSLHALVEEGRDSYFGRKAEAEADTALAKSRVCSEFWIRRGVARDMQSRWFDGGPDFSEAIALAPTNALVWYYYADHLARKASERDLAEAAVAFCLRLDPGNPAGLALRQRLAISPKGL